MTQFYLWGEEVGLQKISDLGDPLEWMSKDIQWEIFRKDLEEIMKTEPKGPGGRPPFDYVLLFRCVVLQSFLNISDDKTEFILNDWLSARRAVGSCLSEKMPDAKTIWHFKNILAKHDGGKKLLARFNEFLTEKGHLKKEKVAVDSTIIEAPVQRNTREENAQLKEGVTPEEWLADDPKAKHRLAQKNTGASWGKKHGKSFFGDKNHIGVDLDSKLILDYEVTSARVHDSKVFLELLPAEAKEVYADSAYYVHRNSLREKVAAYICKPGCRYHKLTPEEIATNHLYSKFRCRIEHIFGAMKWNWNGGFMRCIGIAREKLHIGLQNLTYNMRCFSFLERQARITG